MEFVKSGLFINVALLLIVVCGEVVQCLFVHGPLSLGSHLTKRSIALTTTRTTTTSSSPCWIENKMDVGSALFSGGIEYSDFDDLYGDDDDNGDNNDDDDDDDDDDDIYEDFDISAFRSKLEGMVGSSSSSSSEDDGSDRETETSTTSGIDGNPTSSSETGSSSTNIDDLIKFATSSSAAAKGAEREWAKALWPPGNRAKDDMGDDVSPQSVLSPGTVLLANPARFCGDDASPMLLSKFGLTLPPPVDLGPDRRADLLPVLVLLDRHPLRGCQAVLLNRRTGYLVGDLEQETPPPATLPTDFPDDPRTTTGEKGAAAAARVSSMKTNNDDDDDDNDSSSSQSSSSPRLWAFMIQPLWFGGTSPGGGLEMVHPCPQLADSKPLTKDGLYWGGQPTEAHKILEEGGIFVDEERDGEQLSGFDFKFFVQSTRWLPTQLEKEVRDGTWTVATVSRDVLFKSRDRMGTRRAKPLWTEIMELMGGVHREARDQFYNQ